MVLPILGATLLASCSPLPAGADAASVPVQPAAACMQQATQTEAQPGAGVATTAPPAATPPETPPAQPSGTVGNDIVVTGDAGPPPGDPMAEVNEAAFEVTQKIDEAVVEPITNVYEKATPKPIRMGVRNFLRNLLEPVYFLNYMLQLKPGKAAETLGRFAINSTIGIGGLVDVAKREPFNLPYRPNGFSNTLGYYGVGPGPYFYLPLVGSTTLRDALGGILDGAFLPTVVGKPFNKPWFGPTAYVITSLEARIEYDERIENVANSSDPYTITRETYLCRRKADIDALRNRPVEDCSVAALEARLFGVTAPGVEIIPATPPAAPDAANDNAAPAATPQTPVIVLPQFDEPATDETAEVPPAAAATGGI